MLVSVLTPSFNYATYLRDNLASVQRQTAVEMQHVVIDDGSSDASPLILSGRDDIEFHGRPNRGQAATLNEALRRARGDWICWLPADDLLLPDAAALAVEVGERSGADVVFGDTIFVDPETRVLRLLGQHGFQRTPLRWYGSYLTPPSTFIRRGVLRSEPWDESMRQLLDWDLWLQLVADGARFRYHARAFSAFRRHPSQLSQNVSSDDSAEWDRLRRRHGLPQEPMRRASAAIGHALHIAGKVRSGAFRRDALLRSRFGGASLRWTATDEEHDTTRRAIEAAAGAQPWPSASR